MDYQERVLASPLPNYGYGEAQLPAARRRHSPTSPCQTENAIPQPVIGGATVGVFGTITMNGVRMFTREGLTQRTTTIVGTSVVFGLGIWMASGCLAGEGMPTWVSTVIGSNAVTPTAIMAIVLNLILPQTPVVAQHIDAAKDAAVDLVLPESKK